MPISKSPEIEKALKEGKLVVIRGRNDIKIRIEPKDRIYVVERK